MKKLCTLIALSLVVTLAVNAQDYKKFRVGLGLGYALASGTGASGGVLFALEPSYRLKDNLSLGLRMETALIVSGVSGGSLSANASASALGSYTLNGQYYFGSADSNFRPFFGAGLGMFSLAAVSVTTGLLGGAVPAAETVFGFYPRVGFDLGHFNVTLDYNLIPATTIPGTPAIGPIPAIGGGEVSNSYMGIRLGVYIGGGKK